MPHQPSIQGFYERSSPQNSKVSPGGRLESHGGDWFSANEFRNTSLPSALPAWYPKGDYSHTEIDAVTAGPGSVKIMGRVIHLDKKPWTATQTPGLRASGYIKMVLRDDSGIITVKMFYAGVMLPVRLGSLVSVWTNHVSHNDPKAPSSHTGLYVSVFPERDNSCCVQIEDESGIDTIFKIPLGFTGQTLSELMTLKTFVDGGFGILDCKILVCVKSIGQRKCRSFIKDSRERISESLDLIVFDDTMECALSVWHDLIDSAKAWTPSKTILLMTNPGWSDKGIGKLLITPKTYIDVDPWMDDADWLRKQAKDMARRYHINPPFPYGVFDFEQFETTQNKIKYTLADIDEFVRAGPSETFVGYFSLHIAELQLAKLHSRSELCSAECCGLPIRANAAQVQCNHCQTMVTLRPDPRAAGKFCDETGSLSGGKLIWADEAWTFLLGRSTPELVSMSPQSLKDLEYELKNVRITLLMGWNPKVGKLAVYKVLA